MRIVVDIRTYLIKREENLGPASKDFAAATHCVLFERERIRIEEYVKGPFQGKGTEGIVSNSILGKCP